MSPGTLVAVVRCNWCTRSVGGVDHEGQCVGCRADRLLTPEQRDLLASLRVLARDGRRLGFTITQVTRATGLARHTTYVRLLALRRHGFVAWEANRAATIHLTRGLGHV